jgi:hypothetical protein
VLQTAAFEAVGRGDFEAARGLAEGAMVLGFTGPSLLLVHALACARLGDVSAAGRSLDAANAGAGELNTAQRGAFDAALSNVRAAMAGGQEAMTHRALNAASKNIYGT